MNRDEVLAAVERLRHDVEVAGIVSDGSTSWHTLHAADVALLVEFVETYMPTWTRRRDLDDDLTVERFTPNAPPLNE